MNRLKRFMVGASLLALMMPSIAVFAQDDDMMDEPVMGAWEACPMPENLPEEVTVGVVFALSGPISVYGTPQRQAVDLAVAEINEAEYLGEGTELVVIYEDSNGDSEQAISAMTKLVEEDNVLAVIGPTLSNEAFAADPVAQENGTPVMGVSNTAVGVTDMGEFVFRNSLPESSVIPGTVATAIEVFDLEQVGVMYGDDDDFTVSGYEVFVASLEGNGVEILGEETFARGDVDFSAQLTNLLADEPDALIVSALASEAVQIIIQARELGYEGPIIGGNGFNSPDIIEQPGEAAEGVVVGAAWNAAADNDLSRMFIENYTEAYGNGPDQFATQAYTGAWLMATAIRCADAEDRLAIRNALATIEAFDSPLGSFSFSEDRNPIHDPVVQIVQDGAFTVLTVEAEEAE